MAAVPAPAARRSLIGAVLDAAASRARARGRAARVTAAVRENMLTVAALAAGVSDAFMQGGTAWGLGVLGGALLVLDFKLQG